MEETRENRLAKLQAKRAVAEALEQRDGELGKELTELENDTLVK